VQTNETPTAAGFNGGIQLVQNAEELFAVVPSEALTTLPANAGAAELFANSPAQPGVGASGVEQVFGSSPTQETSSGQGKAMEIGQNVFQPNPEQPVGSNEEEMADVPLSPQRNEPRAGPGTTQVTTAQPDSAANNNSADSLFAAIGMPPPPFQKS
jgi:hypothetical protein